MTIKKSANSEVYNFEGENRRFVIHKETEENSWRIGHLSNMSDLNSRDEQHIFFAECIPHRVFVKVLHGIAVKRCRKRKDTASIQHPGGDAKKKQRGRTGFRVLLDRARCPIANSSHLFILSAVRGCSASDLDPKVTKLIYPDSPMLITNNLKFLS